MRARIRDSERKACEFAFFQNSLKTNPIAILVLLVLVLVPVKVEWSVIRQIATRGGEVGEFEGLHLGRRLEAVEQRTSSIHNVAIGIGQEPDVLECEQIILIY